MSLPYAGGFFDQFFGSVLFKERVMWAIFRQVPFYPGASNLVEKINVESGIEELVRKRVRELKCGHLDAFKVKDGVVKIPELLTIDGDALPDWASEKIVYEVRFCDRV